MSHTSLSQNSGKLWTPSVASDSLVYSIFPPPRSGASHSTIVAFTSAKQGEGVTYVAKSVMSAMNIVSPGRTLLINMDWLKWEPSHRPSHLGAEDLEPRSTPGWEHRKLLIKQLRARSQAVVIDCPALQATSDVLSIASLVDGLVLVVEADRTTKSQIRNAERQIETAGGKILGLVLNKRQYPVPKFIYNIL